MKWEDWELVEIDKAVENINAGASTYSEVMRLWKGGILYRTGNSIRSKIGRELKRRAPKLKECSRCKYEYYYPKGSRCPNCGWPI